MATKNRRKTLVYWMVFILGSCFLSACTSVAVVGSLRVLSLGDSPVQLSIDFTTSVFAHDPDADTSFWLSDVAVDDLLAGRVEEGQIVHIDLLWIPKAGSTPMDSSATNASIRYIIISHGQVGLYVGAGFALPSNDLNEDSVTITLRDASLELMESTEGFIDLLTPAQLSGRFSAQRNIEQVRELHVSLSQFVTDALGKTRFVMNDEVSPPRIASEG